MNKHTLYPDRCLALANRAISERRSPVDLKFLLPMLLLFPFISYGQAEEDNLPLTIVARKDTLYKNISYEFKDSRLYKITATTNTWNNFMRELYIPQANSLSKFPITYEKDFFYDQRGNLIQNKEFLDGVLQTNRRYVLEYYHEQ